MTVVTRITADMSRPRMALRALVIAIAAPDTAEPARGHVCWGPTPWPVPVASGAEARARVGIGPGGRGGKMEGQHVAWLVPINASKARVDCSSGVAFVRRCAYKMLSHTSSQTRTDGQLE